MTIEDSELFDGDDNDQEEHGNESSLNSDIPEETLKAMRNLIKEETSETHKGMQRVVSAREQEAKELRKSLSEAQGRADEAADLVDTLKGDQEALVETFEAAMDEPSRAEFRKSYDAIQKERDLESRMKKFERKVDKDSKGQDGGEESPPALSDEDKTRTEVWLKDMQAEATKSLNNMADKLGLKPEDVDTGEETEALFTRMNKLIASIDSLSEDELKRVRSVRKRVNQDSSQTRTDNSGGGEPKGGNARSRLMNALDSAMKNK